MQKQEILKAVEETYNKACELFPEYKSFPKPTVKFTTRGTSAGRAGFTFKDNSNFLQFNTAIANNAGEEFLNTVQHEIAHLVSYCLYRERFLKKSIQAHGSEFKRIHRLLGGTGERCHNYSTEGVTGIQHRHKWKCGCKVRELTTRKTNIMLSKMAYGVIYRCGSCNVSLVKI